jgi:hypothetical protein
MATHGRTWAASVAALAIISAPFGAQADPATPAVALFVDLATAQLPIDIHTGAQKRLDFGSFPVLISTGSTTDVGVLGHYRIELDPRLSIDSHGSISRTRVDSFAGLAQPGTERGNGQATLHYAQDWLDLSLTPGATLEGPEHGMAAAYTLDHALTLHGPFGWDMAAGSHYGLRSAPMEDGSSGRDGSVKLGLAHRGAAGASYGANYTYGWSSPESAAVSFEQQVAVSVDLAFIADLNCRAEYRQSLSAGAPQNLALDMGWDLQSSGFGATRLNADLSLQRNDPAAEPGAFGGAASLGLAMDF